MEVKGITIHNTNSVLSAREIYNDLVRNKQINLCHYLVDCNEVINCFDESIPASHTGKGYDYGNLYTIAVEIAQSQCDDVTYIKAQERAIKLIKELMEKYDLTTDNIYFHKDFNIDTYCPHRILQIYKTKQNFIKEVF